MQIYLLIFALLGLSIAAPLAESRDRVQYTTSTLSDLVLLCSESNNSTLPTHHAPFSTLTDTTISFICEILDNKFSELLDLESTQRPRKRGDDNEDVTSASVAQALTAWCAEVPAEYSEIFSLICDNIDSVVASSFD